MLLDFESADGGILPFGACCYLVRQRDHTRDSIRSAMEKLGLNNAWLTVIPTELREEPWIVVSLQLLKDSASEGGWPIASDEVGQALSATTDAVLEFLATPGAESARLALFSAGDRSCDPSPDPLPRSEDATISRVTPEELLELPAIHQTAEPFCGEQTEAICAHRILSVPPWAHKGVDIFRFTERSSAGIDDDDDDDDDDDRGRLCFVALDLSRLADQLRHRTVSEGISVLDFFSNQRSKRFLGPMQADLPLCVETLRQLPGDMLLRETPALTDLAELFALVNTWISAAGNRVGYLDEVFFPLLNLAGDGVPARLDEDELPHLELLDLPAAMADQLPYHAPEGELLESFADEELTSLMQALELPHDAGGALWLLDPRRLLERLEALEPQPFAHRCEEFMKVWWQSDQGPDQQEWLEQRVEVDEPALQTFFTTFNELHTLVTMAQLNDLQVALLFYE